MIRKSFSYVFLCLILLNTTGYYGLLMGWQYKHDTRMQARLDAESYLLQEALAIKIPITVPYASDAGEFVRINGTFKYRGTFYRLVKQKLAQDTLTVLCVRDDGNREIHEVFEEVAYTFTDMPQPNNQTPKLLVLIKEYIVTSTVLRKYTSGWVMSLQRQTCCEILIPSFAPSIKRPPRLFC